MSPKFPSGNLLKHPDDGSTLSAEKENFLFLFVSQEQTSLLCSEGEKQMTVRPKFS